jgi:hypothetical protein
MPREENGVDAPTPDDRETARSLGERVTRVAARLRTPSDMEEREATPAA